MIDPEKIFNLFGGEPQGSSSGGEVALIDVRDTPEFKIGMFCKIIMDHLKFNDRVLDWFKRANSELDRDDIELAGEFVIYHRSWFYIKDIDLSNREHWYAIEKMSNVKVLQALDLSVKFFEDKEEYEKCAHLHKLSETVKNFIN